MAETHTGPGSTLIEHEVPERVDRFVGRHGAVAGRRIRELTARIVHLRWVVPSDHLVPADGARGDWSVDQLPIVDVAPLIAHLAPSRAEKATEPAGGTADAANAADPAEVLAAAEIDAACRDLGFFLIRGHGIDPDLFARLDAAARAFFARPDEQKAAIAMDKGGRAWRGWFPEGGELTAGRPDHKEGLYFGAELPADDPRVRDGTALHGPNLFPADQPELAAAVLAWIDAMTQLGHGLVRGIAIGLGLAPDWFDRHLTADPTVLFRIFRYPPQPDDADGWGVAEHTDYGLLTILAHDGTPGLQVRARGRWIDVPPVDGTFVVNLGDMLERMTGGRYRSTPHRVRHQGDRGRDDGRPGDRPDRLSFPFFFDPGWDVEIRPVPEAALHGSTHEATPETATDRWDGASVHDWSGTYGDYLTAKVAKVFPARRDHVTP